MNCTAIVQIVALTLSLSYCAAAAPTFQIATIGLDDVEHVDGAGKAFNTANGLNQSGQVIGVSARRNGGSTAVGQSAWIYDGAATVKIGLTDAIHTSNDGYRYSSPSSLNNAGQVLGSSRRYSGTGTTLGSTAWLYDETSTTVLGFTETEHTRADGYKFSNAVQLNEAGKVIGYTDRFNGGNSNLGDTAWQYNGATTVELGLTGAEYTRVDGYKSSLPRQQNQAGQVVGITERYVGSVISDGTLITRGNSAWLYDGTTTKVIGLTSAEYTSSNGYRNGNLSLSGALNNAGQAIGYSFRFNGGSNAVGQTAWLYDGMSTLAIGLDNPEHIGPSGYSYSAPDLLNSAGHVAGHTTTYYGSIPSGQSTWFFDGATTVEIGLQGSSYVNSRNTTTNVVSMINQAGQVAGSTTIYAGGTSSLGFSTWLYNGAATVQIGLTGGEYIRYDGGAISNLSAINNAGQVAGTSRRYYNGSGTQYSVDAWIYDAELDQTIAVPMPTRNDGYGRSTITYLGNDGLLLGYYEAFNTSDSYLGERAFYFTMEDGWHDLGLLVEGGLATYEWQYLASAVRANGLGQIAGHGILPNGSRMAYLLTPVPGLPGDFNGDHVVDAADYTFWRDHLGKNIALPNETMTLGSVTLEDYDTWKSNFGAVAGGGSSFSNFGVPEPCTAALLAWVLAIVCVRARRFRAVA